MTTPDTARQQIAEQLKENLGVEVPLNRNNYRSMTGDELEPAKPSMPPDEKSEGEAYVREMMAK